MEVKSLINRVKRTAGYDDLERTVGKELSNLLYQVVDEAERMDKELQEVHECLTDLYEVDGTRERIQKTLDRLESL